MKTLEQKLKELSPARRKKIEDRAAQLLAQEMSLRELRRAHKLTQERIAETLGIGQDQVSRLEQRSDLFDFHVTQLRGGNGAAIRSLCAADQTVAERKTVKLYVACMTAAAAVERDATRIQP